MSRIAFAALLAAAAALGTIHSDSPYAAGQDKKADKKKKAVMPPVAEPKEGEGELGRVRLAFDPGSHTRSISAIGFNTDQSKLITVGLDYSIQVWGTSTGERLDILRLPPYGRDNGIDANRWDIAAISADGAIVAMGGSAKTFATEKDSTPTYLVVVDVVNRRIRRVPVALEAGSRVSSLHLSANGDRLAIGTGGATADVYLLDGVHERLKLPADDASLAKPQHLKYPNRKTIENVALTPAGDRLVVTVNNAYSLWDVSGKLPMQWKKLVEETGVGNTEALAWAPNGSHFALSWQRSLGAARESHGMELRGLDGKVTKTWLYKDLAPAFNDQLAVPATLRYLAPDRLFISAIGKTGTGYVSRMTLGVLFDPTTGKAVRRFADNSHQGSYAPFGAASVNGELAATTTFRGLEAEIYRLSDGKIVASCGSRTPTPTIVGWSSDRNAPAVAWSTNPRANPLNKQAHDLTYGFDLTTMEPLTQVAPAAFGFRQLSAGEWSIKFDSDLFAFNRFQVWRNGKEFAKPHPKHVIALTLVPNGEEPPLVAYGRYDERNSVGSFACLETADGTLLADWLPVASFHRDMVPSPDGRYVLTSTGSHRLSIYRTDGSQFPFLNLVRTNGEWVCWTTEGYYAASPGGEKLIGWAVHNGPNEFAAFHPAERFAKQFRRPDVIKLAFEKGSVKEALVALSTTPVELERMLPPSAKLSMLEQNGATVKVKMSATSATNNKPILAMRVLLDGRPLGEGRGVWTPDATKPAEAEFEVHVPAGLHELKTLARNGDGSAVSEPVLVRGPKSPGSQPTLYRVCIGVNDYDDAGLKLKAAAKDATDIFAALARDCVGPDNRFGTVRGELILDKDATRDRVLKALTDARKAAKPGDLLVIFFAGHGVKQGDAFYLLTREADVSKDLKGHSLSGEDLSKLLSEVECPVLLVLDACHSANAVRSFRPATDDLTRSLTDDSVGVTVLSAAMSNEVAGASTENGHFTAGLLKGLDGGEGVPFDPYERQLYVHHLYSVAFSEVRRATDGKQNPFLNMPWTVPPVPLREIPVK